MNKKYFKYVCGIVLSALMIFSICNISIASGNEIKEITTPEELDEIVSVEISAGKIVLLNFFSTQHIVSGELEPDIFSIMQIRVLVNLYEKYNDKGLEIIGISYEENGRKVLPKFIKEQKITYPVYLTNKDTKNTYGVVGRPTIFICDKQGNIFEHRPRGLVPESVLERAIIKLLED